MSNDSVVNENYEKLNELILIDIFWIQKKQVLYQKLQQQHIEFIFIIKCIRCIMQSFVKNCNLISLSISSVAQQIRLLI